MARDQEPMTPEEIAEAREGVAEAFDEVREDLAEDLDEPVPDGGDE